MVYMICYFIAGAIGSYTGSLLWHWFGWAGVCGLGCALSVIGIAVYVLTQPRVAVANGSAGAARPFMTSENTADL
jgi:hypothetical protein